MMSVHTGSQQNKIAVYRRRQCKVMSSPCSTVSNHQMAKTGNTRKRPSVSLPHISDTQITKGPNKSTAIATANMMTRATTYLRLRSGHGHLSHPELPLKGAVAFLEGIRASRPFFRQCLSGGQSLLGVSQSLLKAGLYLVAAER